MSLALLSAAWIAMWTAAPQPISADTPGPLAKLDGQTVRERVRVSVGGTSIRLRLSNEYGTTPLAIGAVTVATAHDWTSVEPASIHAVTFGGRAAATIPAGAALVSDSVAFPVAAGAEISVSVYFPERVATPTWHELGLKRAVVSPRGDHTRDETIAGGTPTRSLAALTAVLVPAPRGHRVVVAFGDSLTDGDGSTVEADHSWPSDLARRLAGSGIAVVNEGIVGNRLLHACFDPLLGCYGGSGIERFERDALGVPGVSHVILLEGVNDIGFPGAHIESHELAAAAAAPTAAQLIDGYRQLIARAHARRIKVIGATITPFAGVDLPGYYSDEKEATRQAVNHWIRSGGAFDGVIDFDAVVRDPEQPNRLLPRLASKDGIHPNDDGYRAMAEAVDARLFH